MGTYVVTYVVTGSNHVGTLTAHVKLEGQAEYVAGMACSSQNNGGSHVERIPASSVSFPVQAKSEMRINLAKSGQDTGTVTVVFHPFL